MRGAFRDRANDAQEDECRGSSSVKDLPHLLVVNVLKERRVIVSERKNEGKEMNPSEP